MGFLAGPGIQNKRWPKYGHIFRENIMMMIIIQMIMTATSVVNDDNSNKD